MTFPFLLFLLLLQNSILSVKPHWRSISRHFFNPDAFKAQKQVSEVGIYPPHLPIKQGPLSRDGYLLLSVQYFIIPTTLRLGICPRKSIALIHPSHPPKPSHPSTYLSTHLLSNRTNPNNHIRIKQPLSNRWVDV